MPYTIPKSLLYQVLFVSCALVLLVESYELTFSVWFIAALITTQKSYNLRFIPFLLIPVAILVIAFFAAFFQSPEKYNYFRDIAYLLKPILGLLIGYNFCKILGTKILKTIVYAGVSLATIHILTLGIAYVFVGIRDVNALREIGGYFDDLEVYVLIFLIFRKKLNIDIPDRVAYVLLAIVGFSSFLYLARTNIIQFFILFFAMKGHLRITKKAVMKVALVSICVLAGYAAIYYSNPRRQGKGIETFLYKIKIAPIEPFKTKINTNDWKDFNDNYRSFENIITVRQVSSEGWFSVIFGKGLGSNIDLGRMVLSNDGEFIRYIPQLHNAYMTIFLKSGLVGVFFLLYFIYLLFCHRRTYNEESRYINYLLVGSAAFLILSNWVFMGLYLKLDNKSLVLGAVLCYAETLWRKHKLNEVPNNE
jgi:hypothetical protein